MIKNNKLLICDVKRRIIKFPNSFLKNIRSKAFFKCFYHLKMDISIMHHFDLKIVNLNEIA